MTGHVYTFSGLPLTKALLTTQQSPRFTSEETQVVRSVLDWSPHRFLKLSQDRKYRMLVF